MSAENSKMYSILHAALVLRGLLRGLDDRGLSADPREMEISAAMIYAALPMAEKLADDLEALDAVESQTP